MINKYNKFLESKSYRLYPEDFVGLLKNTRDLRVDGNIVHMSSWEINEGDYENNIIPTTVTTEAGNTYDFLLGDIKDLNIIRDAPIPNFQRCGMLAIRNNSTIKSLEMFKDKKINILHMTGSTGLEVVDYIPSTIKQLHLNNSSNLKLVNIVPQTLTYLGLEGSSKLEYIRNVEESKELSINAGSTSLRNLPNCRFISFIKTPLYDLLSFLRLRGIVAQDKELYERLIEFEVIKDDTDVIDYISLNQLCDFYEVPLVSIKGWKLEID